MRVRSGDVDIDECCQLRRVHAVSLCAGENYIISERTESSERERAFLAIAVAYSFFIIDFTRLAGSRAGRSVVL